MRCGYSWLLIAGLCVLGTGPAFAGDAPNAPFDLSTSASFQQQAAQVRAGLQPGGQYTYLGAEDRARLDQQIALMGALFERRGSIEAMSGAERVRLFNAQEEADRLLTGNRGEWIKCEWAPITGSHIARTLCWTIYTQI